MTLCDREALIRLLRECGDAPTFKHCSFSGEAHSNLDLRAARFSQCNLEHALMEHSELARTRWLACKRAAARFRDANVSGARFCRSDLNNTDWTGSKLASAAFTEVKLSGARFVDARTLGLGYHEFERRHP